MGLLGMTLVMSGCKKEENVISFNDVSQFKDIDTKAYVTIGEYKGLNVTADTIPVSDLEVNTRIASDLYKNGVYTDSDDQPITAGAKIRISVSGSIDGKDHPGFTSEGYEFVYGYEEQIMDGFTANLKGLYKGEQVQFDLVVPATFQESALVGKVVTFKVTIDNVQVYCIPELTDEYVQDISEVETVEEYKESLVPLLRDEKFTAIQKNKKAGVWQLVSDSSSINSYPEGVVEAKEEQLRERLEMYAQLQGMELEQYVYNNFGVSFEEYVKLSAKQDLLLDAIGRAEKIFLTEKEYDECLVSFASQYGYNDKKTMLEVLGEEKVKEAILWDKVMQYVADQVTITE